MAPDEVLRYLETMGAPISIKTLQRYVRQGLIPSPRVRALGHARGRESEYNLDAVLEAYAAKNLLAKTLPTWGLPETFRLPDEGVTLRVPARRITATDIQAARKWAYSLPEKKRRAIELGKHVVTISLTKETTEEDVFAVVLVNLWLRLYRQATESFDCALDEEIAKQRRRRAALRQKALQDLEAMIRRS